MMKEVWQRNSALLKLAGIIGILLFAFWVGMDPHWDYEYPLHVDEWFHIGYSDAMLHEGSLTYADPYSGGEITKYHEMGFHLLLGSLAISTETSLMELYRVAPGIIFTLLALLVYALGREKGYGWSAALCVPLIPTSIRTLGPAFLVPVAVAILFIPVVLLLLHKLENKNVWEFFVLVVIVVIAAVTVHAPTGFLIIAMVMAYFAVFVVKQFLGRRFGMAIAVLVSLGVLMAVLLMLVDRWQPVLLRDTMELSITGDSGISQYLGLHHGFIQAFGGVGTGLFVLGTFLYALKRPYGLSSYVVPCFAVFLLLFLYVLYPRHDLGPSVLYERGWPLLGLLMAILAGYAVACWFYLILPFIVNKVESIRLRSGIVFVVVSAAGVGMLTVTIFTGLVSQERDNYSGYYKMIDERVYNDFKWLGQNTIDGHKVVVMEPSLALAYPPIAGPLNRVAGAIAYPWRSAWADKVHEMLVTGDVDVEWISDFNTSVLYTSGFTDVENNELIEVRPNIYIVTTK